MTHVRMSSMRRELTMLLVLLVTLSLLWGCAQAPVPATYKISSQKKLQAAHHWDILASDVAQQAYLFLSQNGELRGMPMYVSAPDITPFDGIFRNLLIAQLLERGLQVSDSDQSAITMDYRAQLLRHGNRTIRQPTVKYSALALGIKVARDVADWATEDILNLGVGLGVLADMGRSATTGDVPSIEVIVTTSMVLNGRYMMHKSDIYYINEPDWWHYGYGNSDEGRTYQVVN